MINLSTDIISAYVTDVLIFASPRAMNVSFKKITNRAFDCLFDLSLVICPCKYLQQKKQQKRFS